MSLYGDDCYFYYYSTCNKGTACPYRHVPEARGNETACTLWKAGQCIRPACRYRHMEITVDRTNIPCYWESQPTGCTKPHCPFKHFTEKSIYKPEDSYTEHERSVVAPVNKIINKSLDRSTPSPTSLQQQNRASPKIEPVVVNPFSDDSDEGSPLKRQQMKEIKVHKAKIITFKKDADESARKADVKIKSLAEIRREKEMMRIINDSLEKPLEDNDNELEIYKTLERPTTVTTTRRIVLDNPTTQQPTSQQAPVKRVPDLQKPVPVAPVVQPVVKGNIKSRLGRKTVTNNNNNTDKPEPSVIDKPSLSSRLGLTQTTKPEPTVIDKPSLSSRLGLTQTTKPEPPVIDKPSLSSRLGLTQTTKENKTEVTGSGIKIKSLEEIKAAKEKKLALKKTEDEAKKNTTGNKGFRRITLVETEPVKPVLIKPKPTIADRKQHVLESLKATNTPEAEENKIFKKSPEKRKIRTVKQERAIYVPPGQKSEKSSPSTSPIKSTSTISPSKRSRLSTDSENTDDNLEGKVRVKTFAELMAEKRKRREEEEILEQEKQKSSPKKSRSSNFKPIVFDIDQKDKMATPKVIAATLPFRHKKSALVAPVQNIKSSESSETINTSERKPNSIDSEDINSKTSNSKDVVDSLQDVPVSKSSTPVLDSNTLSKEPELKPCEKATVNNTVPPSSAITQLNTEIVSQPACDSIIKSGIDSNSSRKQTVDSSIIVTSSNNTVTELKSPVTELKSPVTELKSPAAVKRKSSSRDSSEKKKARTMILSDDDILLGEDDDDNNFTLTSDNDDDDILGDIEALLA